MTYEDRVEYIDGIKHTFCAYRGPQTHEHVATKPKYVSRTKEAEVEVLDEIIEQVIEQDDLE